MKIAVAKGKKLYDKRESKKKKILSVILNVKLFQNNFMKIEEFDLNKEDRF